MLGLFANLSDQAKLLIAKFKNLIGSLRSWQSQLSRLKDLVSNVKWVLSLELLEEWTDLLVIEWNFKELHSTMVLLVLLFLLYKFSFYIV